MKIVSLGILAVAGVSLMAPTGHAADAAAGKTVFGKCALCHSVDPAKKNIGPTLFGIVGRRAAAVEGYTYSPGMKALDKTWDEATLEVYLTKPQEFVPGTKMSFAGLPNPEDRANLIAYLATLK